MRNIQTEPRECIQCGNTYDWNLRNIYGLCVPCRKKHYCKKGRLKTHEFKKPYPLGENEKRVRHRRIVKELDAASSREERREIYRKELEYMMQSGIWEWCTDLRFNPTKEPGSGKKGRKPLDSKNIPDTRGMYE
jgi:hypothetical protein